MFHFRSGYRTGFFRYGFSPCLTNIIFLWHSEKRFSNRLFQTGLTRWTGVQGDRGPVALQRDDVQQHAEEGQTEPGPALLLPGGRAARALRQRPRLSGRLIRIRKDNCQGNPSNYDRLIIILRTWPAFEATQHGTTVSLTVCLFVLVFFGVFACRRTGVESGSVWERRWTMLAAGRHAGVDCTHRQGGYQHGPAGRSASRARQRQAHRPHHPAVGHQDQTAHSRSKSRRGTERIANCSTPGISVSPVPNQFNCSIFK